MDADERGLRTNSFIGVHPRSSAASIVFLEFLSTQPGEVVATEGDFWLGSRHNTPSTDDGPGVPARFASLDFETPEPASLGLAGFGLIALGWAARKKIAR